jgi:hypothetical protein
MVAMAPNPPAGPPETRNIRRRTMSDRTHLAQLPTGAASGLKKRRGLAFDNARSIFKMTAA